jgi:hypothetical protein
MIEACLPGSARQPHESWRWLYLIYLRLLVRQDSLYYGPAFKQLSIGQVAFSHAFDETEKITPQ